VGGLFGFTGNAVDLDEYFMRHAIVPLRTVGKYA
jgi:hypothetical protein